jgi:hypothetical protein
MVEPIAFAWTEPNTARTLDGSRQLAAHLKASAWPQGHRRGADADDLVDPCITAGRRGFRSHRAPPVVGDGPAGSGNPPGAPKSRQRASARPASDVAPGATKSGPAMRLAGSIPRC